MNYTPIFAELYLGERLPADENLEKIIGQGTIIDADDDEPIAGTDNEESNAGLLKKLYQRYKDGYIGRKYHEFLGGEPKLDAYGVIDLPENAMAAIIKTSHPKYKNILALSRKYLHDAKEKGGEYWNRFTELLNDYIFPHEDTHAAGELSEHRTERKVQRFYEHLKDYATSIKDKFKYERLAKVAEARAEAQAEEEEEELEDLEELFLDMEVED